MMGYSHAVSAAAGWLILAETGMVQVPDTLTLIVTTLACAGAGMLPDIDHHNGSIANSIPPISRWVARIVGAVSGGHPELPLPSREAEIDIIARHQAGFDPRSLVEAGIRPVAGAADLHAAREAAARRPAGGAGAGVETPGKREP